MSDSGSSVSPSSLQACPLATVLLTIRTFTSLSDHLCPCLRYVALVRS